jgi:hypothetical protein
MRWIAANQRSEAARFMIEHHQGTGFYLFRYDADRCTHDYLQDTFEQAVAQAANEFGVPADAWVPDTR